MLDSTTGQRPRPPRPTVRPADLLRAAALLGFGGYILYTGFVLYLAPQRIITPIGYLGRWLWGGVMILYGLYRLMQSLPITFRKNPPDDEFN